MLALRDELASRAFDLPGEWWPALPGSVGGRDRTAGGTWCVTDVASGTTAVVLNRPEKMVAGPGAASRGVLPLLAAEHGVRWADHVDVTPMAGFNLVLATAAEFRWWSFDGTVLTAGALEPGTVMFTPLGLADAAPAAAPDEWPALVAASVPTSDRQDLLVRRDVEIDGRRDSYETVFGQIIAACPGGLRLDYRAGVARTPDGAWTQRTWGTPCG
jgi:hypothetical protein